MSKLKPIVYIITPKKELYFIHRMRGASSSAVVHKIEYGLSATPDFTPSMTSKGASVPSKVKAISKYISSVENIVFNIKATSSFYLDDNTLINYNIKAGSNFIFDSNYSLQTIDSTLKASAEFESSQENMAKLVELVYGMVSSSNFNYTSEQLITYLNLNKDTSAISDFKIESIASENLEYIIEVSSDFSFEELIKYLTVPSSVNALSIYKLNIINRVSLAHTITANSNFV